MAFYPGIGRVCNDKVFKVDWKILNDVSSEVDVVEVDIVESIYGGEINKKISKWDFLL